MPYSRVTLLLEIQRAILGRVTPNLRMVTADGNEDEIHLIFYYNDEISEEENEMAEDASTEIISGFSNQTLNLEIIRLASPKKMPTLKEIAYWRFESSSYP